MICFFYPVWQKQVLLSTELHKLHLHTPKLACWGSKIYLQCSHLKIQFLPRSVQCSLLESSFRQCRTEHRRRRLLVNPRSKVLLNKLITLPCPLRNTMVHHRVHKIPPLIHILRQNDPVRYLTASIKGRQPFC
jgi:hypothetical protein